MKAPEILDNIKRRVYNPREKAGLNLKKDVTLFHALVYYSYRLFWNLLFTTVFSLIDESPTLQIFLHFLQV